MRSTPVVVGDVWLKDGTYFIVTREKDDYITSKHGEVFYCQAIGEPCGIWMSPDYLNAYAKKCPNFSPAAPIQFLL